MRKWMILIVSPFAVGLIIAFVLSLGGTAQAIEMPKISTTTEPSAAENEVMGFDDAPKVLAEENYYSLSGASKRAQNDMELRNLMRLFTDKQLSADDLFAKMKRLQSRK